jgi:hypothetical protein
MFTVLNYLEYVSNMSKVLSLMSMHTLISENLLFEFEVNIAHHPIVEMV